VIPKLESVESWQVAGGREVKGPTAGEIVPAAAKRMQAFWADLAALGGGAPQLKKGSGGRLSRRGPLNRYTKRTDRAGKGFSCGQNVRAIVAGI